jgi:hypothetical protein
VRFASSSVAFLSGVLISLPALAARVEAIQGKVWINRGEGYQLVTSPAEIQAGDFVMASPGGSAEVVYYDDCKTKVRPSGVVTVARESPCETSSVMHLGARSLKDSPPIFDDPPPLVDTRPDFSLGPALLAGALLVGGVAAVVLLSDDDDDDRRRRVRRASPD